MVASRTASHRKKLNIHADLPKLGIAEQRHSPSRIVSLPRIIRLTQSSSTSHVSNTDVIDSSNKFASVRTCLSQFLHWDSVPNPDTPCGLCVLHVFAVANTRTRPVVWWRLANPANPIFKGHIRAFGLSIAARLPCQPTPARHLMMPCCWAWPFLSDITGDCCRTRLLPRGMSREKNRTTWNWRNRRKHWFTTS